MEFKEWILLFNKVKLPIGDLARDIEQDESFPNSNEYKVLQSYFKLHACDDVLEVFEKTWKFYEASN